jgi:hypothetical protein
MLHRQAECTQPTHTNVQDNNDAYTTLASAFHIHAARGFDPQMGHKNESFDQRNDALQQASHGRCGQHVTSDDALYSPGKRAKQGQGPAGGAFGQYVVKQEDYVSKYAVKQEVEDRYPRYQAGHTSNGSNGSAYKNRGNKRARGDEDAGQHPHEHVHVRRGEVLDVGSLDEDAGQHPHEHVHVQRGEVLDVGSLDEDQRRVLDACMQGGNVFYSGMGGTGEA